MDDWQAVKRILVIRLDNIGDVIMTGPALRTLKHALPEAEITLMASPGGSQVASMLPWVSDVIIWRAVWQDVRGELAIDRERELALVNMLEERQFDAAIILTSFSQSPYPPAYVCYLAKIPLRLGHSNEFGGSLLTHWFKPPPIEGHQVDRNLALLEQAGFQIHGRQLELSIPPAAQKMADRLLLEIGIDPASPFIVLAPGASCAARRYDPARFARVAQILIDQAGMPVVAVGTVKEAETLAPVIEAAQAEEPARIFSLIGQTSLPELAGIICRSSLVLANNSAALHIADAFRRPMVILYSGTEYISQWRPRFSAAELLRQKTECSPCFRFQCPYAMECLDVSPKDVVRAAMKVLSEPMEVWPLSVQVPARAWS